MITIDERSTERVFMVRVTGKVTRDDYRVLLARLEEAIRKHGRISILFHVESLSGVELGALWEDLKLGLKYFRHFARLALVSDLELDERSPQFARHLIPAEARHFPAAQLQAAWAWVMKDEPAEASSSITENTVQSILFATDFSESASTAMSWALALAKARGASLTVLHVAPVTTITSLPLPMQNEIQRSLDSVAAAIHDAGVEVSTRWQTGRPWEVISAEAQEHDLVVLGARGHTPFLPLPLGSTADRVVRTAPAPVLTIHQEDSYDQLPRNVLVPTDFSRTASLALETVARFLRPAPGDKLKITLLHAWQPLVEYGEIYGGMPLPNPYVDTEEQAKELLETLAARARNDWIEVATSVRPGYPAKVIREEAEAIDADLIAIGTHGHSGLARFMLGSVAARVVHIAHCPVLSVRLSAAERAESTEALETTR